MAIRQGMGAELQWPLATVEIGGLISATAPTLLMFPAWKEERFGRTIMGEAVARHAGRRQLVGQGHCNDHCGGCRMRKPTRIMMALEVGVRSLRQHSPCREAPG